LSWSYGKNDRHDKPEIVLKEALKHHNLDPCHVNKLSTKRQLFMVLIWFKLHLSD